MQFTKANAIFLGIYIYNMTVVVSSGHSLRFGCFFLGEEGFCVLDLY